MKVKINDVELIWQDCPVLSQLKYIDQDYVSIISKQRDGLYSATIYNYLKLKDNELDFYYIDKSNLAKDISFQEEDLDLIKFKVELQIIQWLKMAEDKSK